MTLTFVVGGDRYTGAYGWYGYGDAPYVSGAAVVVEVPPESRVLAVPRDPSPVVAS